MSVIEASDPGGFNQPTLSSPPTSEDAIPSITISSLPRPRATPLKAGGTKESSFIDHVDRKLLGISRRYQKRYDVKFGDDATSGTEGRGYESFGELAKELDGVIDVIWVSGTPSLQIPFLLTIALTTCTSLPSFPFAPRPSFQLLHKLDLAFYSLLQGTNAETGETLPGFEGGRGKLSTTEKVRIRGVVERTRVAVVEVAGQAGSVTDTGSVAQTDTEDDFGTDDNDNDDAMEGLEIEGNHGRWEMEIARVYERTIVELGTNLDSSGTGGLE